ncbi:MAG: hypothetical protein K9N34_08260 [Candidatus Marinimicrobia bacterium]|nr:hypothetical protein [Candidatus Neomarinimicrobiota bacterium]MCF7840688.1 hypothetical protein [Candidatus Neomarinimicrobiota bacterium]MCF7902305.1 hypothetical protein [Candidatus Neomarinimicrobiota bacterium]
MTTRYGQTAGFTLVELSTSMTVSTILLLTFAAILIMSRQQTEDLNGRLSLYRDLMVLDLWTQRYITNSHGDSVAIYATLTDEINDSRSSEGTILHLFLPDSTWVRLAMDGQQINWQVGLADHYPLDSPVSQVRFRRMPGQMDAIRLQTTIYNDEDSLSYDRLIVPRN